MLLYEQKQNRGVNKFFHSQRYKNVQKKFREKFPIIDKPITILDIGCGTAKLFNVLNEEFKIHYTGVELREDFIAAANERYGEHKNFEIKLENITKTIQQYPDIDVIIALETFEHIPEKDVTPLLIEIGKLKPKLFIASVPIEIGLPILMKNTGSLLTGYIRHKEYTWKETFYSTLGQTWKFEPHGTAHKGFNWKILRHQIHHYLGRPSIIKMPNSVFSTNVMFIVEN